MLLSKVIRRTFSTGSLFTWGETTYGWGRPVNSQYFTPGAVEGANQVVQVSAGQYHLGFITKDNSVFTTGLNEDGQLGLAGESVAPRKISLDGKVNCISCGTRHSLALTHDGAVYSWGYSKAVGREGDASTPTRIPQEAFQNHKIVSVAAADDFSVALCDQGHVYSWGFGLNYMKGWTPFNDTPAIAEPVAELLNKRHSKIKKMAAVDRFVMLLLDNGRLYSYGNSKAGVFGARTNPLVLSDLVLTSFFRTYDALYKNEKIVDFEVSAGALIFRTETDRIFYNGMFDKFQPTPFPVDVKAKKIFATESSVGVITEEGKLYFLNDKIIEDAECIDSKNRVFYCEDPKLSNIVDIGGNYGLRYALTQ